MVPSKNSLHAAWPCRVLIAAALFAVFGLSSANAIWEWRYGGVNNDEGGRRGAQPVAADACGNAAGYISIGWSDVAGNSDVYVVRTNCNGARIFETTIDITGAGDMDRGRAIQPTFNSAGRVDGYVLTGWTAYTATGGNGTQDVFIARIDCNGNLAWARTYGQATRNEGAHDLIIARTGDPSVAPITNAGDIVVAGYANEPVTGRITDGYVIRTNNIGVLITDVAVDYGPAGGATDEIYFALTELSTIPGQTAGDIMAVGATTANGGRSIAQRLSAQLACGNAATYGGNGSGFFSVTELQRPTEVGPNGWRNVVAVGDNGGMQDILAVKIPDGNPICQATTVEKFIGASVIVQCVPTPLFEVARDVKEVTFVPSGSSQLAQWDIVLTGWVMDPSTTDPGDAFFLALDGGLTFQFATSFDANMGISGREEGWSIYPDIISCSQAFLICGNTTSWGSQDLYLLQTDVDGRTGCENLYTPVDQSQVTCQQATPNCISLRLEQRRCPTQVTRQLGQRICPFPITNQNPNAPSSSISSPEIDAPAAPHAAQGEFADQTLRATPTLQNARTVVTGLPLLLKSENATAITVTNRSGQVVARFSNVEASEGQVTIPTVGLLPGSYTVTIDNGSNRTTTPFSVY